MLPVPIKPLYIRIWEKITAPIVAVLRSGLTIESISMSFAIGITCGLFPMPGLGMAMGALLVYIMGANLIAATAVNYLMTPFYVAALIPFIRGGEYLFGVADPIKFSLDDFSKDYKLAAAAYFVSFLRGCVVWFLVAPIVIFLLYHILKRILGPFIKGRV